jgi:hypothetical protein
MTGQGWITGSDIRSRPSTKDYRENYDSINWRQKKVIKDWQAYQKKREEQREPLNGNTN